MRYIFILFIILLSKFSTAQIITETNSKPKAKKEKLKRVKSDTLKVERNTFIYLGANWSNTYRTLTENKGLFGDPLGERANEKSLNKWAFSLGFQSQFHKHFYWDGGFSYYQNGEQYKSNLIDTSYRYKTTYSYLGMPIRINFTYGKKLQLIAGVGIEPALFLKYKQERFWTPQGKSSESTEVFKTRSDYNSFVFSALANVGIKYNFSSRFGLYLIPEARWQLNSSYIKTASYKHKALAYGFYFGLTFAI